MRQLAGGGWDEAIRLDHDEGGGYLTLSFASQARSGRMCRGRDSGSVRVGVDEIGW